MDNSNLKTVMGKHRCLSQFAFVYLLSSFIRNIFLSAILLFAVVSPLAADNRPVVAAAASLRGVLPEIAKAFTRDTGHTVRIVFGSSGNIARQIIYGAPFEVFLSADEQYVLDLDTKHLTIDSGAVYAVGRLALLSTTNQNESETLESVIDSIINNKSARLSMANPEHAPYGQRAKEVLVSLGAWDAIEPHLVFGENISQALQFAVSGDIQGGFVSYPLALLHPHVSDMNLISIDDDQHTALIQRMVLLNSAGGVAKEFYQFVLGSKASAIFSQHGFIKLSEHE